MTERLRLLIIGTSLRERSIGGGESFLLDLVNALGGREEFQVGLVLSREAAPRLSGELSSEISVIQVKSFTGTARVLRDLLVAWRWSAAWGADVTVYPHEWRPLWLGQSILILQNVLWMHPETRSSAGLRGIQLRLLTRLTAKRASRRVAVSELAARLWSQEARLDPGSIHVLPEGLGFDPGEVTPAPVPPDVVIVSGVAPYKGYGVALEACEKVLEKRPSLKIFVAGLGGQAAGVTHGGFVSRAELLSLMKGSKVVVFPSAVESFGLPAFEATALGRNCVVRSGTAMADWLQDKVTTFDGSAADLARAVIVALDDRRGRVPVGDFRWDSIIDSWSSIICELGPRR